MAQCLYIDPYVSKVKRFVIDYATWTCIVSVCFDLLDSQTSHDLHDGLPGSIRTLRFSGPMSMIYNFKNSPTRALWQSMVTRRIAVLALPGCCCTLGNEWRIA